MSMRFDSFESLQAHIQRLYQKGAYEQALELAIDQVTRFPEQAALLNYWQVCMAARLDQADRAVELLARALEHGFWYGETLLRKSPSLLPLQGRADFERLVQQNRIQQRRDQEQLYPVIVLREEGSCQPGGPGCPLLIALHANGSTAQASVDFWKPAASSGWLVAVPQSSQAMWKDAYMWDDMEVTKEEVRRHYTTLTQQYAIDMEQVVLAGHAMGAEAAMRLAFEGIIPVRGFIALGAVGPYMEELESWSELIEQGAERDLYGYLIYGGQDNTVLPEAILRLREMLQQAGMTCEVEKVPEAGHGFHPAYAEALLRGLAFIARQE